MKDLIRDPETGITKDEEGKVIYSTDAQINPYYFDEESGIIVDVEGNIIYPLDLYFDEDGIESHIAFRVLEKSITAYQIRTYGHTL